jgi:histidinol phosphatase-like PHP family hydrolase
MPLRADLHLHTHLSSCSSFRVEELIARVRETGLRFATVTDHGDAAACAILRDALPEVAIVFGVEVTTQEGDFLIYSTDEEYVRRQGVYAGSVAELRRDERTAIVWAHPRIPQVDGWTSPSPQNPEIDLVLRHVDALEIFNGMMLHLATQGVVRPPYFDNLSYLAERYGVGLTGGSDAHEAESFLSAWTEFEGRIETPADVVRAIKEGRVRPFYDRDHYDVAIDLRRRRDGQ